MILENFGSTIGKVAELSLWIGFFIALLFGALLSAKLKPVIRVLQMDIAHPEGIDITLPTHPFLKKIEDKYLLLMKNTDNINALTFSAGETNGLRFFRIPATKLQYYINQAPALLVSIGLLGTFAGLTTGLGEIQEVLRPNISPQEATAGLVNIITPMSLAFRTSLLGLTLSLTLTVLCQITGWRHQIEQLDDMLAAWLETIVPIKLGEKLSTPLRTAIDNLNQTSQELPNKVAIATGESIRNSFRSKLDEFFELYAVLAAESNRTMNSLNSLADSFRESGSDYLDAATAFDRCSFAADLQQSVDGLKESRQEIVHSTKSLCEKLSLLKDDLSGMKSNWNVLTALSAEQLHNAKDMLATNKSQEKAWADSVNIHQAQSEELTKATKELRNTRLEVRHDRKAMQDSATALEERMRTSTLLDDSFISLNESYNHIVENWKTSSELMSDLYRKLFENLRQEVDANNSNNMAAYDSFDETNKKLIERLNNEIISIKNYNTDMGARLDQKSKGNDLLEERVETLKQGIDLIIQKMEKDQSQWNQPWRFRK